MCVCTCVSICGEYSDMVCMCVLFRSERAGIEPMVSAALVLPGLADGSSGGAKNRSVIY